MQRLILIVATAILLTACGGEDLGTATRPTDAPDETPRAVESKTTEPVTRNVQDKQASDEPAEGRGGENSEQESDLPGLGTRRAAWESSRQQAPGYTVGAAYGPVLDGEQPTYAGVYGDERILSYSYQAPASTSNRDLLTLLEATELPRDSEKVTVVECEDGPVHYYRSAALAKAVEGAQGFYLTVDRYPDSDYVSSTIGVSFSEPSC